MNIKHSRTSSRGTANSEIRGKSDLTKQAITSLHQIQSKLENEVLYN